MSPSAKKFVDKIYEDIESKVDDGKDLRYKELEVKCDEILDAIKYLPMVSGEYNSAEISFESANNKDETNEEPTVDPTKDSENKE